MNEMAPPAPMGFEVKLECPILGFLYLICPVYVVINGTKIRAKWGTQFFPAGPGRYSLACFTHYLFYTEAGKNGMESDLYPGQIVRITWTAPMVIFLKGPIYWEVIAGPHTGFTGYIP